MRIAPEKVIAVLVAVAILAILGIAGQLSYHDELQERATYCQMVREGAWPDYRHIYARECRGKARPSTGTGRGS